MLWNVVFFFFLFGAYSGEIFTIGRTVGFSVALNWGIRAARPRASAVRPAQAVQRRRVPAPQPQAA